MVIRSYINKRLDKKRKDNWEKLIKYIQDNISKKGLTPIGYETTIQSLMIFNDKYKLKEEQYLELSVVSKSIVESIKQLIGGNAFNINEVKHLTRCITTLSYQEVLFDFSKSHKESVSPEYFFCEKLWNKIIEEGSIIPEYEERIVCWLRNSAFFDDCETAKRSKRTKKLNRYNCCAYFLTFFVLSLMLKMNPDSGYKIYLKLVESFKTIPEIVFILHLIMFYVLRYLNDLNYTYFNHTNDLTKYNKVFKEIKNDIDTWFQVEPSTFSRKFKKTFLDTLIKISRQNCKESTNTFFNINCQIAGVIMGDDVSEDSEWKEIIEKTEKICVEVFC